MANRRDDGDDVGCFAVFLVLIVFAGMAWGDISAADRMRTLEARIHALEAAQHG